MRSVKLPSLHSSMKPIMYYASTGSKESSLGYGLHVLMCLEEICGCSWHWSLHVRIIITILIIQTSYPSPETLWVAVFIRAEEDLDGSSFGTESGGSLPHGQHRGWEVLICLKIFSWAYRRGRCWKPYQGIFLYTEKPEGGKELVDGAQTRERKQATITLVFMGNSCISWTQTLKMKISETNYHSTSVEPHLLIYHHLSADLWSVGSPHHLGSSSDSTVSYYKPVKGNIIFLRTHFLRQWLSSQNEIIKQ